MHQVFTPLALIGLTGLTVVALVGLAFATRRRVNLVTMGRFCDRYGVPLNDRTIPLLARTLVAKSVWRRCGLAVSLVAGLVWNMRHGELRIEFFTLFVGWFLGAVVAEWRINARPEPGTRRSAGLRRRSVATYASPTTIALVVVTALALVACAVASLAAALLRGSLPGTWWAAVSEAAAAALVVGLAVRRVVHRSSPAEPEDLRGADDAVRAHSLSVLAGCAIALATLPVQGFLRVLWPPSISDLAAGIGLAVMVTLPLLGWCVTSLSGARFRGGRPRRADTVGATS